jgi:hypothetical protein
MLMDLALLKGEGPNRMALRSIIDEEIDPEDRFSALGFSPFERAPDLSEGCEES